MLTSPDGINWTIESTPPIGSFGVLRQVIWVEDLVLFVAVGVRFS